MRVASYRLLLGMLVATVSGCGLLHLQREIQQAHRELVLIPGRLDSNESGRDVLVALLDKHGQLVRYRIAALGETFYFTEVPAEYQLLAFDDRNGNFALDPDEPRQWLPQVRSSALQVQPDAATRERLGQLNPIHLKTSDLAAAPAVNLSLDVLYREQPRLQSNYLQPVSFDDPRFDAANTQLGAWQPLTFIRQLGYGLYLLAPWDPDKEPVFLVHGINSSPRDFQALAAGLDHQRFQLLLFHFPSGVPLNNSAYMLSLGMRDVQRRFAPQRVHVLAHSMGGLVARRAVQMLSADDSRNLCLFITLSTPWEGHPSAATGLQRVPVEVPVWKDLAPGSPYLQQLFAQPLPRHIHQWLLASYAGNSRLLPEPNDGVVPVASQLRDAAQDEATHLFLLNDSHTAILQSKRAEALLERAFNSLPASGCTE